jgi:uncharacterized protein YaiL (DUF2058 family)
MAKNDENKPSRVDVLTKQINDLKAKKQKYLQAEKAKQAREQRKVNAQKRKLEAHLKILIGGYVIAEKNMDVLNQMLSANLRETDRESLKALIKLLAEK